MFVSVESYLKDVHVSYLFLNKKDSAKKLAVFAIMKNFSFHVYRLNKMLYALRCFNYACSWQLRATKLKYSDMSKVSKYESMHTCQKILRNKITNKQRVEL